MLTTVAATLAVGWPLTRALESLFWSVDVFDGDSDADMAAQRIVDRHSSVIQAAVVREQSLFAPQYKSRDCELEINAGRMPPTDWGVVNVNSALHGFRNGADFNAANFIELKALRAMPRPLLGALSGCIEASLLASLCGRYAESILMDALVSDRSDLVRKFAQNATRLSEMQCIVADGVTAGMRN